MTALQHQLTDAGLVASRDRDAAAPMGAARHRLHAPGLAGDIGQLDEAVVIAHPLPVGGRAQRLHDGLAKDLRQRPTEQMQQRQRQLVDAHIVVLPEAAGRLQRPGIALPAGGRRPAEGHRAIAVDLLWNTEATAFPFTGLLQQLGPGDLGVVRRAESDICLNVSAHWRVRVRQQATVVGNTGQQREIGLGDAEGQVGSVGLAPGRDLDTPMQDRAAGRAPGMDRPSQPVVGRRVGKMDAPVRRIGRRVACPGRFARGGKRDRLCQPGIANRQIGRVGVGCRIGVGSGVGSGVGRAGSSGRGGGGGRSGRHRSILYDVSKAKNRGRLIISMARTTRRCTMHTPARRRSHQFVFCATVDLDRAAALAGLQTLTSPPACLCLRVCRDLSPRESAHCWWLRWCYPAPRPAR